MRYRANFVIANRILYCPIGFIDLSATTVVDKYYTGFKIDHKYFDGDLNNANVHDIIISTNQAKIGIV
jgi:hypothetical protein